MASKPKVYLVGAGPGDPGLLTVKALRLIQQADIVVYDRLISDEILHLIPHGITRLYAGKASGAHSYTQDEINELLVQLAGSGHCVVRLKGGDPYIFGRGSEEALFLTQHGIDFEVIPGITAASAASAYAGIPLTHRGLANGITFITGHLRDDEPLSHDWSQLRDPQRTLLFYMGLSSIKTITHQLIEAGRAASTPAAVVENASTPAQRCITGTLATLPLLVKEYRIKSPALIFIGNVASLANTLGWYTSTQISMDERYASLY